MKITKELIISACEQSQGWINKAFGSNKIHTQMLTSISRDLYLTLDKISSSSIHNQDKVKLALMITKAINDLSLKIKQLEGS